MTAAQPIDRWCLWRTSWSARLPRSRRADVARLLRQKVAVEVLDAQTFWPAEGYHQDYTTKNPLRYKYYRWNCGRDQRVEAVWNRVQQ